MMILKEMKKRKSLTALVLAALLLFANVLATPASADDDEELRSSSEIREQLDEMEAQQAEIEAEIAELESQLQDNLTEMEAIVAQKNLIDQEVFLLHKQVDHTNEMISAYNVLIADKQAELNEAQERLDILNEQNKERIRAMEEDGALSYWSVLFKANSFADLLDRLNMIEEIAAADKRRLDEMKAAAEEVALAQAELAVEKANLEKTQEQLAATEAELLVKREEANLLLADLIATGEEFQAYLEESEVRQQELIDQINEAEQEYEDAVASESESKYWEDYWATYVPPTTAPPYVPPETQFQPSYSDSGWRSPLNETSWITSPYGMRLHPIHGDWRMHHGVDLYSYAGQTIVAARSGYVSQADWDPWGGGNYVRINHGDGFSSVYMHMTYYVVSSGQYVEAGQVIGYVGSTGGSTGPHLHFGIYYNGSSVNPADYVDFS